MCRKIMQLKTFFVLENHAEEDFFVQENHAVEGVMVTDVSFMPLQFLLFLFFGRFTMLHLYGIEMQRQFDIACILSRNHSGINL